MAKYYDDDEDRYDYDFMPTKAYDRLYNKQRREANNQHSKDENQTNETKIKSKKEYIIPVEFEHDIYKDFIEKVKADQDKKIYDDFDAQKLYYYMLTLRHYYADVIYNFYKKYAPEKIEYLSTFIIGEISGNKLEYKDINYDKNIARENKDKFLLDEAELIKQRKDFGEYQTHHQRSVQGLFNKKKTFLVLQQRGLEAKLMHRMYKEGFYIDLGIKATKDLKKMFKEEDTSIVEDFFQLPIMKEILVEKNSKIKDFSARGEFLIKCRNAKEDLVKLKPLFKFGPQELDNFELYSDSKYVEIMRNLIDKSIKKLDTIIDQLEVEEINDYYKGAFKLDGDD